MEKLPGTRNYPTSALVLLIVLFGLSLRLMFFSGMSTSDDLAYSRYSYNLMEGVKEESSPILLARTGITYPTALSYSIFGINDFSSVLFVLLTSIGNIILAYHFGKLLYTKEAGLMTAFLMAIFPLEIVFSTRLLTDLPASFFMAWGVYIFLRAEITNRPGYQYFISGLLTGIGFFIRESAMLIALFFLGYMVHQRRIKKEYFLLPIGFLLVFFLDMLLLATLTGDFFFRFTTVQDAVLKEYAYFDYFGRLDFPETFFHYPYVILTNGLLTYFFLPIFGSIIYLVLNKKKQSYLMIIWLASLLFYLSFGSISLSTYIPFRTDPRYFALVTMPGVLLLSFFLTEEKKAIKKFIMPLSLALLLTTSAIFSSPNKVDAAVDNLKELYPSLGSLEKPIYTDGRSALVIGYLAGY